MQIELDSLRIAVNRVLVASDEPVCSSQRELGVIIRRIELYSGLQILNRKVGSSLIHITDSAVCIGTCQLGIKLYSVAKILEGFIFILEGFSVQDTPL